MPSAVLAFVEDVPLGLPPSDPWVVAAASVRLPAVVMRGFSLSFHSLATNYFHPSPATLPDSASSVVLAVAVAVDAVDVVVTAVFGCGVTFFTGHGFPLFPETPDNQQ